MIKVPKELIKTMMDYILEKTYYSPTGKISYLYTDLKKILNENQENSMQDRIKELEFKIKKLDAKIALIDVFNEYKELDAGNIYSRVEKLEKRSK